MEPMDFLSKPKWFKSIYVWSGVWQGMGWSSIIYISALSGVDYEMHEAAIVDGATKLQRILHIDLPSIKPTIIMMLILQLGSLMNVGFEKVIPSSEYSEQTGCLRNFHLCIRGWSDQQ